MGNIRIKTQRSTDFAHTFSKNCRFFFRFFNKDYTFYTVPQLCSESVSKSFERNRDAGTRGGGGSGSSQLLEEIKEATQTCGSNNSKDKEEKVARDGTDVGGLLENINSVHDSEDDKCGQELTLDHGSHSEQKHEVSDMNTKSSLSPVQSLFVGMGCGGRRGERGRGGGGARGRCHEQQQRGWGLMILNELKKEM